MISIRKVGLSLLSTYMLLAIYISSTRGLGIPWREISDWSALVIALIVGAVFYINEKNPYIRYGAPIGFIVINAFPAFMFVIFYVCAAHGKCL